MDNHIFILSDIGREEHETSLQNVREQYNPKAKKVFVHINSAGGEVPEGKAIYDFIREIKQPVHTIGEGMVASIATLPFLAGDTRELKPNCEFLGHLPSVTAQGNSDEIDRLNTYMQEKKREIASIYSQYTGKELNEMIEFMRLDTPISALKAKEMGFATEVPEFKAVAIYKTKNKMPETNGTKLDNLEKKLVSGLERLESFFTAKNEDHPDVNNITAELADGSLIFIESENDEVVGKVAFIADPEGQPTEDVVPTGTHEMADGRTITIGDGGIIEAVSEASGDDKEAMAKEIAELKQQLENSSTEKDKIKDELNKNNENVKKIEEEVKNLRKTIVGGLGTVAKGYTPPIDKSGEPAPTAHPLDGFAESLKQY